MIDVLYNAPCARGAGPRAAASLLCLLVACAHAPPQPAPRLGPAPPVQARIVAINDFHGYLLPPNETVKEGGKEVLAGGAAYLATHVGRLLAERPGATAVVAAGDLIGASPLVSALFHDEPTVLAMDLLGLDVLGVGNHEFDEGLEELLRMKRGGCHPKDGCLGAPSYPGAGFAVLAANVRKKGGAETILPPYTVKSLGGVRVAFIGMTLEGTASVTPPVVADLEFADEVQTANALVPLIRAQGIEAMVVVIHEGGLPQGGYDACRAISGPIVAIAEALDPAIDLIISGHTHQAYNCKIKDRVVTSAGSYGRFYTQIDLSLDASSGEVLSVDAHNRIVTQDVPPEPRIAALVERYRELAEPIAQRVVARISGALSKSASASGESTLGDAIADAQLAATRSPADGGAQVAFMNSGGIRTSLDYERGPGEAEDGLVSYGEIFAVQPFGNTIVTVTLTGAQILELLEDQWEENGAPRFVQVSSSFRYTWRQHARPGERVVKESVEVEGKRLDLAAKYRVAVNSFMAQRGVLAKGEGLRAGPLDLAAFEAYLKQSSPYAPPALGRIQRVD